jgi:L-amino acid N-acyltransferase YncA
MRSVIIRPATMADAPAITAIYNHSVLHSTATYQEVPETEGDRCAWLASHGPAHPVLVAERGGHVAGWASLSPFHPRSAFRHTVESSVYIAESFHRQGLARALMHDLIGRARTVGHHVILAVISADQQPSIALHESLGGCDTSFQPMLALVLSRRFETPTFPAQQARQTVRPNGPAYESPG